MKLSERHDRLLGKEGGGSVKASDDVELPDWLQQVLALGPKRSVRDKFNELHLLATLSFTSFFRISKIIYGHGEALCEMTQW